MITLGTLKQWYLNHTMGLEKTTKLKTCSTYKCEIATLMLCKHYDDNMYNNTYNTSIHVCNIVISVLVEM